MSLITIRLLSLSLSALLLIPLRDYRVVIFHGLFYFHCFYAFWSLSGKKDLFSVSRVVSGVLLSIIVMVMLYFFIVPLGQSTTIIFYGTLFLFHWSFFEVLFVEKRIEKQMHIKTKLSLSGYFLYATLYSLFYQSNYWNQWKWLIIGLSLFFRLYSITSSQVPKNSKWTVVFYDYSMLLLIMVLYYRYQSIDIYDLSIIHLIPWILFPVIEGMKGLSVRTFLGWQLVTFVVVILVDKANPFKWGYHLWDLTTPYIYIGSMHFMTSLFMSSYNPKALMNLSFLRKDLKDLKA